MGQPAPFPDHLLSRGCPEVLKRWIEHDRAREREEERNRCVDRLRRFAGHQAEDLGRVVVEAAAVGLECEAI